MIPEETYAKIVNGTELRSIYMNNIVVYVHGKGGSAEEAARYKALFPDSEVIGFDYLAQTPWEAKEEFPPFFAGLRQRCGRLTLIASSIGAFFSLSALDETLVDQDASHFSRDGHGEADRQYDAVGKRHTSGSLRKSRRSPQRSEKRCRGGISAMCGSIRFQWRVPTRILYGERDNLTSLETISAFAEGIGAELTVMPGGEHWFHTEEQMRFLDRWITKN